MLGFKAVGIEIDPDLCEASRRLVNQFDIPVQFVTGSFIPAGADVLIADARAEIDGDLTLVPQSDNACAGLGLDTTVFDVVFAYPWPHDQKLTATIFDTFASADALLLTYEGAGKVQLRRKV